MMYPAGTLRMTFAAALIAVGCSPATVQARDKPGADDNVSEAEAAVIETVQAPVPPPDPRTEDIQVDIYDPGGEAMVPWLTALRAASVGTGQARIAWWGASHTAADLWSGRVRRDLQTRFGDAGHGYLLPFRWHGGYRHQDINLKYSKGWKAHRHKLLNPVPIGDYGYGGVAMSSGDGKQWFEVATTIDNEQGRKASRFEVWLRPSKQGGTLRVSIDGRIHELSSKPAPADGKGRRHRKARRRKGKRAPLQVPAQDGVLFFRFDLADGSHRIRAAPKGDGEVYIYGVTLERQGAGVIVDQMGIPGMRGKIQLHWEAMSWQAQLRRRDPHLLVLAYGTNAVGDKGAPISRFRDKWRRVLERLRAAVPRAACLLVGPTDRPTLADEFGMRTHRPRTDLIIAAQKQVAAEYGCGFWDAFAAMGGRGSMLRWVQVGLGRGDHVHLSRGGYELKAERFVQALLRHYKP